MYSTHLRKVGGSIMLAVPPAILDQLHLETGARVELAIDGELLIVNSRPRIRYTMAELLAQCDPEVAYSEEEAAWTNLASVGLEL